MGIPNIRVFVNRILGEQRLTKEQALTDLLAAASETYEKFKLQTRAEDDAILVKEVVLPHEY